MRSSYPSVIELAVVAYCIWQSSDLRWSSTPSMRWGWLAFLIWLIPIVYYQIKCVQSGHPKGYSAWLLGVGVIVTFFGSLGSLNALRHIGLACALAGLIPTSLPMIIWLPASVSWMPAFGYVAKDLSLNTIAIIELAVATIGTVLMFVWWMRGIRHDEKH